MNGIMGYILTALSSLSALALQTIETLLLPETVTELAVPVLALLLFLVPRKAKSYAAFVLIVAGSYMATGGILSALFSISLPYSMHFSPLASVFAIPVVIVGISSSLFACGYMRKYLESRHGYEFSLHYICLVLLFYSMLQVLAAEEKMHFLFNWELMSLSSFLLVLWKAHESRKVIHAAVGYLIMMHVGLFLLIFGFFMLPSAQGLMGYGAMPVSLWTVFFVGFGIKVGVFPVHGWLPVAHPAAPGHVSALMSASMLNIGVYGIFRATLGSKDILMTGMILLCFGAVTALFGVYRAARETHLKRLIAYSSIDNMGIILFAIGLGAVGKATGSLFLAFCGYAGALIHMLCHSTFKSALFMCSGVVEQMAKSLKLNDIGGLLKKMPLVGTCFLVAVLSAMSIPPFSGFAGEFVLLGGIFSSFASSENILLSLFGLIFLSSVTGTSVMAMVNAYSRSMLSDRRDSRESTGSAPNFLMSMGIILMILIILVGAVVFPLIVFERSEVLFAMSEVEGRSVIFKAVYMIYILAGGAILLGLLFSLVKHLVSSKRMAPSWGCGADNLNPGIQYSASSISAEFSRQVASDRGISYERESEELYRKPSVKNLKIEDRITRIMTRWMARVMHYWTTHLALLQTGKVNHYIFHALMFIVLIGLLSIFGLM